MVARVVGACVRGVEGQVVFVEADVSPGLPTFDIVGLAERSVRESRERVRAAVRNAGEEFPARRVTVNLAPATVAKEGAALDLPIALGVMLAAGRLTACDRDRPVCALGELGLEGEVRAVRGALPMVVALAREGFERPIVPQGNLEELALLDGVVPLGVRTLRGALGAVKGRREPHESQGPGPFVGPGDRGIGQGTGGCLDLSDVVGQDAAKRAMVIAAAGGHHVLMVGPPGCGKTMLARRLPGLLPPLDPWEAVEVLSVYSAAGERLTWVEGTAAPGQRSVPERPFRAPHHSSSLVGVLGGAGRAARPGELALAHKGVLFLDEFGEFNRAVIEALRQPLEEGFLRLARAAGSVTYPADFILVAASNPCRCGFFGDLEKQCRCSRADAANYRARLAGPVADRIDLHMRLRRVSLSSVVAAASTGCGARPGAGPSGDLEPGPSESSRARGLVVEARERQRARVVGAGPRYLNARVPLADLQRSLRLTSAARKLLVNASARLELSARSFGSALRVARTVADLSGSEAVTDEHIAEALTFRAP